MNNKTIFSNYYTHETVDKIRKGYYSAIYFWRTKNTLEKDGNLKTATMQIFQRHEAVLCGMGEVLELLKKGTGYWEEDNWLEGYEHLSIEALRDGAEIKPLETVMLINGPYHAFAHLESLYLGILARRTLVATNTYKAVKAAGKKPVVFFADRFDHFLNQEGDGYAAKTGGAAGVATPAQADWWQGEASGTMPHSMIALYDGDTAMATEKFGKYFPDKNLIALVDFDNDVVGTSLQVAKRLGKKLWGVRIDTSFDMVDKSLQNKNENIKMKNDNLKIKNNSSQIYCGVNPYLVKKLREELDKAGFNYVKILASGGFTVDKISYFEKMGTPIDAYGVGSALLKGENDFTADIVKVEGKQIAKAGRGFRQNPRLKKIEI